MLFCVKAHDTEGAAVGHLPRLLGDDTAVISLQNGIDNAERIAGVVGRAHIVGGLAFIFAAVAEPGVVAHPRGPAKLIVGELDGTASERVQRLRDRCTKAGIDAEVSDDIRTKMWHKYAFICAQAGTTAAVGLSLGEIRAARACRRLFRRLLEEAYAVAAATAVAVPEDAVDERLAFAEGLEPGTFSSLHDDLVAGRRMELDALHGTLVRLAHEQVIPVPATEAVYGLLQPWARRIERPRD